MTVSALGTLLNSIHVSESVTMKFAHFAWSHAPSGDYGVYAEDDEEHFDADNVSAEGRLIGSVHYFTRDDSGEPKTKIESALRDAGVYAYINTIQYEDSTGYIHYDWRFIINGTV